MPEWRYPLRWRQRRRRRRRRQRHRGCRVGRQAADLLAQPTEELELGVEVVAPRLARVRSRVRVWERVRVWAAVAASGERSRCTSVCSSSSVEWSTMHRTPLALSRAATVSTSASRSPATNCRKNVWRAARSAGRPRPSGRCTAARRSAQPASTTARLAHACNKTVDRTSCGVGSTPRPRVVSNTIRERPPTALSDAAGVGIRGSSLAVSAFPL